jgi:hypothetical protein
MPSVEDLWATRRFDASPISVSMRTRSSASVIVETAEPRTATTQIVLPASVEAVWSHHAP